MTRPDQSREVLSKSLPELFGTTCFPDRSSANHIYDVRFYPYTGPGVDPIFAFAVERKTVICRIREDAGNAIEVIRSFEDEDSNAQLYSLTWSQNTETGDPMICVTGARPPKIRVLDVNTGKLVKTLIGHGERINDLVTSPSTPTIIASGSEDNTVRIWDLTTADDNDACKALLAGGGHRLGLQSIAFHRNGHYLLSGGLDTAINLWVLSDLVSATPTADENIVKDRGVALIHYPHFSTTEVHGDHVDCVEFYNDLIISKSAREPSILLWRIVGFSSAKDLPPRRAAPTQSPTTSRTRSAFSKSNENAFQVLLRFDMPNCKHTWCHFGLFHSPRSHPLLIMGSDNMWISLWDLQLIEEGLLGTVTMKQQTKNTVPAALSSERFGVAKKELPGPFETLRPHKAIRIPNVGFKFTPLVIRHFSFSPGGQWCVVVGDDGMISVLRWRERETLATKG